MSESVDFNSDDVLGFEEETDAPTGQKTGMLKVMLKDGTERLFRNDEADQVRDILQHFTPPTA
ncbi:MAG TPA: hypothetical protein VKV15_09280 [Bryobacteraceae bacterium]|nr:hypothetical protein [Bryobacteraceae bacterium]